MKRALALACLALLVAPPLAGADTRVASPPVTFIVEDQREANCTGTPVESCPAKLDGGPDDAANTTVDVNQSIRYVGVALDADALRLPTPMHLLLPDAALMLHGEDLYVRQPALRTATETWHDANLSYPGRDNVSPHLTTRSFGVAVNVTLPAVGTVKRVQGFEYSTQGVGYEQMGPYNKALESGFETDTWVARSPLEVCHKADACDEAQAWSDAYRNATPNVKTGIRWEDVETTTDPTHLHVPAPGSSAAASPPDLAGRASREPDFALGGGIDLRQDVVGAHEPASIAAPPPAGQGAGGASSPWTITQADGVPAPAPPSLLTPLHAAVAVGAALLLLLAAAALYSRFPTARDVLRSEQRRRILDLVRQEPGLRLTDSAERLGLTRTALTYHVEVLLRAGLVELHPEGGHKRIYARAAAQAPGPSPALLSHPVRGRLVRALLAAPRGLTRAELHDVLADVPKRTRNHTLRLLVERAILVEAADADGTPRLQLRPAARAP